MCIRDSVTAIADVKMGDATATAWGCDLTYDYIKINADSVSYTHLFACYVLLQKEKLLQQIKKAMYAMFPEKPVRYLAHVWNLANRIFSLSLIHI